MYLYISRLYIIWGLIMIIINSHKLIDVNINYFFLLITTTTVGSITRLLLARDDSIYISSKRNAFTFGWYIYFAWHWINTSEKKTLASRWGLYDNTYHVTRIWKINFNGVTRGTWLEGLGSIIRRHVRPMWFNKIQRLRSCHDSWWTVKAGHNNQPSMLNSSNGLCYVHASKNDTNDHKDCFSSSSTNGTHIGQHTPVVSRNSHHTLLKYLKIIKNKQVKFIST